MKVILQRPLEPGASWNRFANSVYEVSLRPLAKGWYALESIEPSASSPADGPLPFLHKGYFDSHLHVTWMGLMQLDVDLRKAASPQDMLELIRRKAASGAAVVRAYGWDEGRFGQSLESFAASFEGKLPENVPVIAYRVCGHSALVNRALRARAQLPQLPQFVTDRELKKIQEVVPAPTHEESARAFELAQRQLVDKGVSAVGDMSLDETNCSVIRSLALEGKLMMDVQGVFDAGLAPSVEHHGPLHVPNSAAVGPLDRPAVFSVRHWKRYLDGSFGSRTAWLSKPYSDAETHGERLKETATLVEETRQALMEGFFVAYHAIGDAALEQALEVGERLRNLFESRMKAPHSLPLAPTRHRLEHVQLVRDDQIARLKEQGFWAACVQPNHRLADMAFSTSRLGPGRLRNEAYRALGFQRFEVPLALGSDAPVDDFDPKRIIEAACSHENPHERLSLDQAVWLFTTGSRLNLGVSPGRIAVGSTVYLTQPEEIVL
jgi:predicted amidohydrolase YtcJ